MIPRSCTLEVCRLPVSHLLVEETAPGDPQRVLLYYNLLLEQPENDTDPIVVEPRGNAIYAVKNGRHRKMAHVLAGRDTIAAVIVYKEEPNAND